MQCTRPKTIAKIGQVSCGKCPGCRARKANEWTIRIQHEINHSLAWFNTLTIDDEKIKGMKGIEPFNLRKSDLQLYHKRLTKAGHKFKYFSVGEYGGMFGRAHYHEILLDYGKTINQETIEKAWKLGFVMCKHADEGTIRYVLKYLDKERQLPEELQGFQKPFQIQSINLGKGRNTNDEFYIKRGKEIIWPRYYRKIKYGEDKIAAQKYLNKILREKHKKTLDKLKNISYIPGQTTPQELLLSQIEKDLESKRR